MSQREERIVLAAAVLASMHRDDRHTAETKAAYALEVADATLAAIDATEPDEDSDDDLSPGQARFEAGYEVGYEAGYEVGYEVGYDDATQKLEKHYAALLLEFQTAPTIKQGGGLVDAKPVAKPPEAPAAPAHGKPAK